MYGTQTEIADILNYEMFENDVEMYGTQTENDLKSIVKSLRMM